MTLDTALKKANDGLHSYLAMMITTMAMTAPSCRRCWYCLYDSIATTIVHSRGI
jgi:uncharacterized protein (DUF2336 family)